MATQRDVGASAARVAGRSVTIRRSPGRAGSPRSRRRSAATPPADSSARSSGSARITASGLSSLPTQAARLGRRGRHGVDHAEEPDDGRQREGGQGDGLDGRPALRPRGDDRLGEQREDHGQERQHQQQRGGSSSTGHHGDGEQQDGRGQRGPQLGVLRPGQPGEHDPGADGDDGGAPPDHRSPDARERAVARRGGRHRDGRRARRDGDREPGGGRQPCRPAPGRGGGARPARAVRRRPGVR